MKTWKRLPIEVRCGRCGATIYKEQPVLVLELAPLQRPLYRCPECDGPVPEKFLTDPKGVMSSAMHVRSLDGVLSAPSVGSVEGGVMHPPENTSGFTRLHDIKPFTELADPNATGPPIVAASGTRKEPSNKEWLPYPDH